MNARAWSWSVRYSRWRTRLKYLRLIRLAYRNWWAVLLPKMGVGVILEVRNGTRYLVRPRSTDLAVVNEAVMLDPYLGAGHVSLQENAIVVDLGANIGDFTVQVAKRCPLGIVVAVEPIEEHVRMIGIQLLLNGLSNVRCRRLAVGAKEGAVDVTADGSASAVATVQTTGTERVRMTSLQQLLCEEGIESVDILKMDCEGAEFDILVGAEEVLPRVKQLCLEFHCTGGWTPEVLAEWLRNRGFVVSHTAGPWNGLLWARRT